ncbi:TPA: hemagglutinin repeat-containing protein, partial [Raoultella planticola]
AGRDMALSGKNVAITAAENQSRQTHEVEQKTSGLTLALSGTAGSALNSVVQATQDARSAGSSRLQALQGVKAALSGVQASQAARLDAAQGNDPANNNTVGVSLSYGSQSSKSTQRSEQTTAQGSSLTAGRDLSITAREGDLNAVGSQLKAGNDVALSASRDINLVSAENTSLLEGKNDSHGGTVGVGIGVGSGGWGISVSASANKGKGSESGNGTTHSETTVDAGNRLTLNSGRDTTLTGAQVSGDKVVMDVGRNLTLTSEQDSDRYDSKQQNASAGGSFTFGSMSGSASVNLSKDKMHSNYDSVVEQTGIFAGKGGYDITVGEHTQLNGAVIGSTATADKNRLDTGTLGWGDIDNRADFKTEHQSVGFSSGGSIGSQFAGNMANGLLTGGNNEGHDSSTTHAAISEGDIIVRDKDRQQQDVANLSHDVEHANQTLSPIFDKEKEQQRLQQTQLIGEIGNQVADIARTEGQISAINAGKAELAKKGITEPEKGDSKEAWERYNAQLAATDGYKAAQQQWGTGSSVQQAIQAATAAVQGLAGSDLKAALAGGAAPYVAEVIGHYSNLDDAGKVAAHAVVNAALAAAQNQSALAGAAGAATAEIVGIIATQMYGKTVSELDETQKQTVSTLATLAAGLAGGLTGGSTADTVTAAQAGKTTVENNALSDIAEQLATGQSPADKLDKLNKAEEERFKREECAELSPDVCAAKMYDQRREALKDVASFGIDFVPVAGDIKSFAEAQSALDYLVAVIGLIPGAGDAAGKAIKAAETALKKGDVTEASKLINKASDEVSATLPMGSKRNQMNQPSNPSYQPVRNQPITISNREYSGHALDRMQDRGITPSVVENAIKNGNSTPSRGGTTVHFDPESKVSVVTNETGKVVTVKYGDK